jgi:hypothetical protein
MQKDDAWEVVRRNIPELVKMLEKAVPPETE